ncbi:MAG: hypothetical protein JWP15_1905 [Alphaproteobacteria bacterium]|nr:hypothetical protein [Alphaproteobacteria bacterium]
MAHAPGGLPERLQSVMEAMSGFSLADVLVHRNSAEPARLGAYAFTRGSQIHLGPGQDRHLPHEAWHVVQQKQGRVQPGPSMRGGIPLNDDAGLEREADSMGQRSAELPDASTHALRSGPRRSAAMSAGIVQRAAVKTLGGEFTAAPYDAWTQGPGTDPHGAFGGNIKIYFAPSAMVKAGSKMIGLVQTVKTLKTAAVDDAQPTVSSTPANSPAKAAYKLTAGDVGRGIDKFDRSGDDVTNTNPFYASENSKVDQQPTYSTALHDTGGNVGLGHHWTSGLPNVPASLFDKPQAALDFAGQKWKQSFEVTALVGDGRLKDTYLGSIAWGLEKPAEGQAVKNPADIELVSPGIPSPAFMAAATSWNTYNGGQRNVGQGEQVQGGKVDVVKLPLATQDANAPDQDLAGAQGLLTALGRVAARELAFDNQTTQIDKTNTGFQKLALAQKVLDLLGENYGDQIDAQQDQLFTANVKTAMKGAVFDCI